MSKLGRKYGWKKEHPLSHAQHPRLTLPVVGNATSADLRSLCPPIWDQGQLGSCTSHAIAFAYYFDENKQKDPQPFMPCRLFIYYNERAMEGTVDQDAGAEIKDGVSSIGTKGVCNENLWPYDVSQFTVCPPPSCYAQAYNNKALQYYTLSQDVTQLKQCLMAGYPFICGISVYDSFEADSTIQSGMIPMPDTSSESLLGGHAVGFCGFDDAKQCFLLRNSWGTGVGQNGYFWIPYAYLADANLASDFWTVRRVQ
jgi:C1A family cysteine protease